VVVRLVGASGDVVWRRELYTVIDGLGCEATRLASGANGDALLGGCDLDNLPDVRLEVLALAAADGTTRWHRSLAGPRSAALAQDYTPHEAVAALTTDPFGNVVAAGATDDATHGLHLTVVKWGADGSETLSLPPVM
jgi:hypothetical protein